MNSSDRLNDLLESWCDGLMTPTMASELDRLLASDPLAARRAAVYFDLHRILLEQATSKEQMVLPIGTARHVQDSNTSHHHSPSHSNGPRKHAGSQRLTKASSRTKASGRNNSHHPRYSLRFFAAGSLLLLTVVMVVLFSLSPTSDKPIAPTVWLEGEATVLQGNGLASPNALTPGAHLIAGSNAVLCYADGSRFQLKPDSSLSLSEDNEKKVRLTRGIIYAQVTRQPQGKPFRIITPSAELVVVGTQFRVIAEPERTLLTVNEGLVQFISTGINELVKAGGQQASHQRQILIPSDATWSYRDDGVALSKGWQISGFDAKNWGQGKAPLGYNPNAPNREKTYATIIGKPFTQQRVPLVTYFRHEFSLSSLSGLRRLVAHLRRDNGAVLYLNGIELGRDGMPTGLISSNSPALEGAGDYDDSVHTLVFPSEALRVGVNCLAVQIHQTDPYSSDMLFGLELIAESFEPNSEPKPKPK